MNRYYDPARGRFTTPDPAASGTIARPNSWNRYAYTEGDPVNFNDPEGLFVWNPNYGQAGDACSTVWTIPDVAIRLYLFDYCGRTGQTLGGINKGGGGGGGGHGGSIASVTHYSTTSLKAIGVQNSLRILQAALLKDSDCGDWLSGSQGVIDTLVGNTTGGIVYAGVGNISSSGQSVVNAIAGSPPGTNLPVGALLTINVGGAFFSSAATTGYKGDIGGGSDLAKAFILLHELAHLTDAAGFQSNDSSSTVAGVAAQNANNLLVEQKCSKTLDLFGGHF